MFQRRFKFRLRSLQSLKATDWWPLSSRLVQASGWLQLLVWSISFPQLCTILKKVVSLFLSIFAAAVVDSTLKGFLTSLFDRYGAVLPDLGSEREERGVAAAVAAAAVGFIPAVWRRWLHSERWKNKNGEDKTTGLRSPTNPSSFERLRDWHWSSGQAERPSLRSFSEKRGPEKKFLTSFSSGPKFPPVSTGPMKSPKVWFQVLAEKFRKLTKVELHPEKTERSESPGSENSPKFPGCPLPSPHI